MSDPVYVCGTGTWNGPKPGDPDNNISLSATTVFGGIQVSWSYPQVNGYAVAHTLVYRALSNNFNSAVQIAVAAGSIYMDHLEVTTSTRYYYWIQVVSLNGTVNDRIGPVSATARVRGEQTLEDLTGMIDAGVLANALKTEIGNITNLGVSLVQEIKDRLDSNIALGEALAAVQSASGEALTYINHEVTERTSADSALVASITSLAAGLQGNTAAIIEEQTARVTKDEALTQSVSILNANFAANTAAIINEQEARSTVDTALAKDLTVMLAQVELITSAISEEQVVRADAIESMASDITLLFSESGDNQAAILSESETRTSANTALAKKVDTAQTTLNGNIASVQTSLTTNINNVAGKVTSIGALYTAKVDVNGLVGGFGVYNDGKTVEAGFDVDRFWVGRTSNKVKPFIIDSGVVYMDKARIRDADIDTLKIAGNAVTVPLGRYFGTCTSASLSVASIPAGTAIIAGVSWSLPAASATMYMVTCGQETANSVVTFGASSFTVKNISNAGVVTVNFTSPANGVQIWVIGCKK